VRPQERRLAGTCRESPHGRRPVHGDPDGAADCFARREAVAFPAACSEGCESDGNGRSSTRRFLTIWLWKTANFIGGGGGTSKSAHGAFGSLTCARNCDGATPPQQRWLEGCGGIEPAQFSSTRYSVLLLPVIIHKWGEVFGVEGKGSYKLFFERALDKKKQGPRDRQGRDQGTKEGRVLPGYPNATRLGHRLSFGVASE